MTNYAVPTKDDQRPTALDSSNTFPYLSSADKEIHQLENSVAYYDYLDIMLVWLPWTWNVNLPSFGLN